MDKLQPIIRNRFWILAGLVIPMGLFAYYSANGSLKQATEERVKAIDGVKSGVSSGNEPNEDYTKKLEMINTTYTKWVDEERINLWEFQKERMVWPVSVANQIPDEFMGPIDLNPLFTYKGEYKQIMVKLVTYAQPVMPMPKTKAEKEPTWKQKVILAATLPSAKFGTLAITSEEMWNAQIDIWLTTLLLDAVRNLNEDKDSITESILRRIDTLELIGGTGEPVLAGGAAGGSESGDMAEMYGPAAGGGASGEAGAGAISSSVAFDPAQEFGTDGSGGAGGGGADYMTEGSMPGDGAAGGTEQVRYIAESEDAPYLERGFYMSVIIMQNKIPDFLVELTNSPWPIRIVRFQIGENPYYTEKATRSAGPGGYEQLYDAEMTTAAGSGQGRNYQMETNETGRNAGPVFGALSTGLPEFATGALNHPDLVQLDLAGAITIYKQPTELIAQLEEAAAAEGALVADPSTTPEAIMPTEAGAAAASPASTEELPGQPTAPATEANPALGATPAPAAGEAAGAPASNPVPEETPLIVE